MVDAGLRDAEFLHGRGSRLPGALALFALRQVQFAYELRQPLVLQQLLIVVIPLNDLLLMRSVVL